MNTISPGPGSYQAQARVGKDGPNFSMKGKYAEKLKEKNPGPGSYDVRMLQTMSGFTYGTEPRGQKVVHHTPGPNMYSPREDFTQGKGPSWQMGTSQRQNTAGIGKDNSPGPGNYLIQSRAV